MMVDDAHPILMVLQLHVPLVRMAKYLRGYAEPSRASVKQLSAMFKFISKSKTGLRTRTAEIDLPQQTR